MQDILTAARERFGQAGSIDPALEVRQNLRRERSQGVCCITAPLGKGALPPLHPPRV